ncbi:DUF6383 domain-containing protein [Parabacteroides bouchesdurhonensis]|uniref:DUF6383 domain-containing protein n=1 Tax=Parabacteroides bouchesdurhonensis TaxID=1936995 RepID=UPI000C81C2C2|nr:DUF6383 domain-containing protein [Parabacteroides bouchesdurhonensis]
MNKRFSTLLAAVLVAGSFSASAQVTPGTDIATQLAPADKYYHIVNGTDYLAADKRDGHDSIKVMSAAAGTANFTEVISLDSCMWKLTVDVQKTTGDSVFTFENKATRAKINLPAKDANAIVVDKDPITEWGWKTTANGPIQAKIGNDVFSMILDGGTVKVKKNATAATTWTATEVGNIKLSAEYLNQQNSNFFQLAFGGDINGNLFTKYKIKAIDFTGSSEEGKSAGQAAASDSIMLQVIDAKKDFGTKFKTDTLFIVADTVQHKTQGAAVWAAGAGFVFSVDSLGRHADGDPVYGTVAGTPVDTVAAAGRALATYLFAIEMNTGRIAGDSLIIRVNTPGSFNNADATSATTATVPSNVAWGYLGSAGTKVLTTSPVANEDALPYITLGAGTKADIDVTKSYYVQVVKGASKDNNGKYWASLLGQSGSAIQYVGEYSDLMPSTQWSVLKDGAGRYQLVNRDDKSVTTSNAFVYAVDGNYAINGDTVKLTAIDDAIVKDKYLGYKHFTATELSTLSVKLQFVTPLGTDAYVYVASGDSMVKAKAMDESDAMKFKLVAANGATDNKFGANDLVRSAYLLKEQFGDQRVMGYNYNEAGDKVFRMMKTNQTVGFDSTAVYFRATKNAGEYQLVIAQPNGTQFTAPVSYEALASADSVVTIAGSGANLAPTSMNSTVSGYFKIVTPAAPDYVNVTKNSSAHMQITSTENTSLMIGMSDDFKPVLKSETEMDATYSLFIDTAKVTDPKKPLFYIMTTAGLNLKAETSGDVMANYLNVDKDGNLEFILAKQYGIDKDTLLVYNRKDLDAKPDTVKMANNKAVFAFRATPADGEMLIEAANGKCMKQDNGKIILVNSDDALAFTTKTVDTPTSNDAIEANTISVVAGEGNVTVYGAAGKTIIVSDVVGHNTTVVATSDAETIPATSGVVIVKVGSEVVKTVVD